MNLARLISALFLVVLAGCDTSAEKYRQCYADKVTSAQAGMQDVVRDACASQLQEEMPEAAVANLLGRARAHILSIENRNSNWTVTEIEFYVTSEVGSAPQLHRVRIFAEPLREDTEYLRAVNSLPVEWGITRAWGLYDKKAEAKLPEMPGYQQPRNNSDTKDATAAQSGTPSFADANAEAPAAKQQATESCTLECGMGVTATIQCAAGEKAVCDCVAEPKAKCEAAAPTEDVAKDKPAHARMGLYDMLRAEAAGKLDLSDPLYSSAKQWNDKRKASIASVREKPTLNVAGENTSANCQADQASMNACSAAEYKALDDELNALYKKQMARLVGNVKVDGLRVAQRAWLRYVESDCLYQVGPRSEGGSIWPYLQDTCMSQHLRTRIELLKGFVECREEGCIGN